MDVAILAAARFPIAEPFAGGMEAHTHVLAGGLIERGHRVTVFAAAGGEDLPVRAMLPVAFEPSAVARRDVSAGPHDVLAEHHSYLDAVLDLSRSDHQIVHLNAVHHLPFACSDLLAPRVVTATLHSPPTPWLESALALARARRHPPRLASVSLSNRAEWGDVEIDRVIPNGVDLAKWPVGPGGDGAVWSGRLVPEKAPHLAIDACRRAGLPLRLFGPAHDGAYFADSIKPRLGGDIEYLGHGTVAELATVVGNSAVAVVTPTWDEPFGLVVIEALACGTPVAALARGALPQLLDDTVGALASSPEDLATAVVEAAGRDRGACRRRAEERHSSATMVDAYEGWFEELLAS